MRRVETALVAIVLAVLALGIALLPLLAPPFTSAGSARFSQLPSVEAAGPAESTRRFVVTGSEEARQELERLMPPDAVSHLDDVRRVIAGANTATLVLVIVFATWGVLRFRSRDAALVVSALRAAAVLTGLVVFAPAAFALLDFDAFFAAFHAIFFAAGTWTFPSDSLLIRLFPEAFWIAAGVSWAVLVLLVAALYAIAATLLGRRVVRER